jgi:hypothetical protein
MNPPFVTMIRVKPFHYSFIGMMRPVNLLRRRIMNMRVDDDTDPAVQAMLIAGYRAMSPAQKLERVRSLTQTVQEIALADIRRRHPEANEREQMLRLASRWLDRELMVRAFGWDVRKMGY